MTLAPPRPYALELLARFRGESGRQDDLGATAAGLELELELLARFRGESGWQDDLGVSAADGRTRSNSSRGQSKRERVRCRRPLVVSSDSAVVSKRTARPATD
jgi:hypothetical protein